MISFFVSGEPQAKAKPQVMVRGGRPLIYPRDPDGKRAKWAEHIAVVASGYCSEPIKRPTAVSLDIAVYRTKPPSNKLADPTTKPDLNNFTDLIFNALEGIAYENDSQVIAESSSKEWGDNPGVLITVKEKP
jgi:Holliday junction resolvase RusA-like endonuclease